MARGLPHVEIRGLRELRAALKAIDPKLAREVNAALRRAVEPAAADARRHAPHLRGQLQRSIRAGGSARGAVIGARAPHAGVQEFGGTIRFPQRGFEITLRAQPFLRPAAARGADDAIEAIGDAVDKLASAHGFK